MRAVRQFLRTYRLPLIAVALAALHSLLFWSLGPRVPLGLCIAAVMVSAWQGGMRASVLATALCALLLAVLAHYQAPGPEEDLVLRLGLFVLVGFIAGYLSQQCRHAIRAVDQVHDVLGGSGIAIISADTEGRVSSLNPLARSLTGLGDADAHGRPLAEVFRVVHGPARQPLSLSPDGASQPLPEGALLLGPAGGETAVEGTVGPARDGEGRPVGVMVVFRESVGRSQAWQELRQRADRFRAMAGYAPAGLMVLDAEGRCVFSNPAAQTDCGCGADESLGEGWSRHVQPQDRDRLISGWLRAVVSKEPFADEFRVVTGAGPVRWLRLRSEPMLADGGEVLGHVAALEEVTGHKQVEAALADARRESEEHLQEWAASEKKAEEALRKAQGQVDERGTALRRAEDALRTAQAEAEQRLREEMARRQQIEEEAHRLRDDAQRFAAEREAGSDAARTAAQQMRDAWREEVEAVVAMHLAARAALVAELTGHREALQATRDVHEQLQSSLAEKDGAARSLQGELDRLQEEAEATRAAHDRLQALLAERGGNEESLRKELDRLAEDAATIRQSHDRLQGLLAEKDRGDETLRKEIARLEREATEARDARDRHQARLAEKGGAEESLRKELGRLAEDAAALRQSHDRLQGLVTQKDGNEAALRQELERLAQEAEAAGEVHDQLRATLTEKDRAAQALQQELERLREETAAQQQAQERLRQEKEFLEGVIDGSPAGIFAHDRDGRCRVWNPALERLLGRPRTEALGRTATELFPGADNKHPAQEAAAPENGRALPDVATAGIGRSELLESAHAAVRDPSGEVVGGMALVRVLPPAAPLRGLRPPPPSAPVTQESAAERPTNGAFGQAPTAVHPGDGDWLGFN
jgi:PAS domain S-box-containing protein